MNEQIEQYVTTLIGYVDAGVDASIDFLSAEIPLYIQELLMWYGIKSFLSSVFGVILFALVTYFFVKHSGRGTPTELTDDYKETLTHDDNGKVGGHALVSFVVCSALLLLSLSFMSLDWLQIWIAPRVWLLEYATSLTK